ncbi:MAG: glycosyltransferase family 4 protein [Bacilli bacterium]|nr:glycosyltransferase family 4 protein [Bacilli bacterium]
MSKKILLICNESVTVINFRKELIEFLIKHNYIVDVLCADDRRIEEIKQTGVNDIHVVPFTNRGTNPFTLVKLKKTFFNVIKKVKPDIVFTFETKPNIIGASAAYKCKVPRIVSMVEGLGNPFQPMNFKGKIIRTIVTKMYRNSLKHNRLVIFLNEDDKKEFINRKIVKDNQSLIIPGIGIDIKNIAFNNSINKEKKIVMLCRLNKIKGIIDYCELASLVRETRKDIFFELYGDEQDVLVKDLAKYIDNGDIKYCGYTNNPLETIRNVRLYVSTSFYREGFPRTFLEAMAVGTPIIATDTIGSRDAIKDGINGYMLHIHDIDGFAKKIIEIIDNEDELKRMSESARKYCEEHFDSDVINNILLKQLESL